MPTTGFERGWGMFGIPAAKLKGKNECPGASRMHLWVETFQLPSAENPIIPSVPKKSRYFHLFISNDPFYWIWKAFCPGQHVLSGVAC